MIIIKKGSLFQMEFKVKAGRFTFDRESKKVKVSKEKGLIHIQRNEEQQTHFKWANLETHEQEIDLIVFAGDAVFEAVVDKNNTYVLRFQMDEDRYFFWLQEKIDPQEVVGQINKVINYEEPEDNSEMVDEAAEQPQPEPEVKPQPVIPQESKPQPVTASNIADLIRQFGKQGPKPKITALTHLSEVVTSDALSKVINHFNQEEKAQLLEFMPEEMRDPKFIASNLRSPQFQQALDVLSDALNGENSIPLFMELGLNQQYLQKYYGVQAFLMALIEWAKNQGGQQ